MATKSPATKAGAKRPPEGRGAATTQVTRSKTGTPESKMGAEDESAAEARRSAGKSAPAKTSRH